MARLRVRSSSSFSVVVGFIILLSVIDGASSALTKTPRNVIIQKGGDVYMECSTDAFAGSNTITWEHDGADVTRLTCTSSDTTRFNVSRSTTNDCFLVGHANAVSGNQGPYHCSDGSGSTAEAVAVFIDPKPTCGVITNPPIRGENVTLSCVMSYNRLGDERRLNPGADMSASISWETAAGTVLSSSLSDLDNDVGETLQVDVIQLPTGTEIPSYNCTASFTFSEKPSENFKYALNSLSWTCLSAPVLTWYCPSSVTVSPSSGPYKAGDVLTCTSDGHPEPSYTWTDSDGVVVSNGPKITLTNSSFVLSCTATGNLTEECSASVVADSSAASVTPGMQREGKSNLTVTIIAVSVTIAGVLIIVLIVVLVIVCIKRGQYGLHSAGKSQTNEGIKRVEIKDVESNETGDKYANVSGETNIQDSVVCNGKDFGYETIPVVDQLYAQVNRTKKSGVNAPSDSDRSQYAEIASLPTKSTDAHSP